MKLRTLAVVIAVAGAAAAGGCSSAPTTSQPPAASGEPSGYWTQSRLLAATPWREPGYQPGPSASTPPSAPGVRVGALFEHDASGDHFCTAGVVASPGRGLLITAAHCINGGKGGGYRQDIVFIPGYRDGQTPSGIWAPARLVVAAQWMNSSDPDFDVGFVVLKPQDGKNIEDVLGADQLGIDPGYRNQVRVTGYRPAPMPRSPAPAGHRNRARPSCGSSATGSPAAPAAAPGSPTSTCRREPAPSWE
jgi:hypothetical protein